MPCPKVLAGDMTDVRTEMEEVARVVAELAPRLSNWDRWRSDDGLGTLNLVDEGKRSLGSGIVAIVGVAEDGKAGVVVGVTDDLTQRFSAVDLVKRGAEALGGKGGGGRPDMAQAGGPDGAKAAMMRLLTLSAEQLLVEAA